MIHTTRAQRLAIYRTWLRTTDNPASEHSCATVSFSSLHSRATYREFRNQARPGPGCIMLPFAGMWLGIEPDGYTHS